MNKIDKLDERYLFLAGITENKQSIISDFKQGEFISITDLGNKIKDNKEETIQKIIDDPSKYGLKFVNGFVLDK